MKSSSTVAVVVALAVSPLATSAAPMGPEFGIRAGYVVPFGDAFGDGTGGSARLKDAVTGGIPLWIDAGYRFAPEFYAGVSASYGFLFPNNCDPTVSCSARDFRLGLDLRFHLLPDASIDPWLGVGVGYEWLLRSISSGGQSQDLTLRGFEFFNVQVGADFFASPVFRVGPFAQFSLGRYTDASTSGAAGNASGEISSRTVHEWLAIGIRAAFLP